MRKILGVLLAGALVVGACSDGGDGGPDPSENPKEALIEAFEDFGEGDGLSVKLSVASDEESLSAAFAEGDDVPPEMAETVLDSSITIAGNNAETPEDAKAEIIFELAGEEAAEMSIDGYDLYLRADVPYILETFGQDPAVIDQQLSTLPEGMDFVEQAVDNEWIHLTGLEQLAQQAEASGGSSGIPNISEEQQKAVEQLSQTMEQNSEVVEGDEDGPGTHLEVTVDLQAFLEDFEEVAAGLGQMPGGEGLDEMSGGSDVPEGDLIVDAWVEDGSLTQIEFDLIKNAEALGEDGDMPEGVEELGLLLEFDEFDGDVEAPDDAVDVSFEEILGAMMGGFGAMGGETETSAPGAADPCEAIADLPANQQEAYKDICPDL